MNEKTTPKMRVRLGEDNELRFSLSIKGSISDATAAKPKVRFMVTETKTGTSICFPMENLGEGTMGVKIPNIPHIFKEGIEYLGQVEVIVGNRWFAPTTVGLVFERELKVEATPILSESPQETPREEEEEEEFSSFIKPEPKAATKRSSLVEGMALDILFSEKPIQQASVTPPSPQVQAPVKKPVNLGLQKIKNNLKSMINEAWNEMGNKK